MLRASLLLVFVTLQAVVGKPVRSRTEYAVKEVHRAPRQWTKTCRASGHKKLLLQIGVKQGRFDELERHLYEVSDPNHIRYGQHLTHEEVNELVKPTNDALTLVHEWLAANEIQPASYSPSMDWINVYVDVETAERLLDAEYHVFKHEDGTELIRAPKWSLPKHLHEYVDAIQPTTSFMRTVKRSDSADPDPIPFPYPGLTEPTSPELKKVCTVYGTTPDCFATLYKTKGYVQKVQGENQIGVNNFLDQIPIRSDAENFLAEYRPDAIAGAYDFKLVTIDGGRTQNETLGQDVDNSQEANLDMQIVIGMTYPMPVTAYSTGGEPPEIPDVAAGDPPGNEPYLTWINYVLAQSSLPQVISTSYGDDEQTVPLEYAQRVCNGFAQLGARGVSLLFASGDGGVGDAAFDDASECISNDGNNSTKFMASFPSSCPFVTAVGATQGFEPETSASRPQDSLGPDGIPRHFFASGSGFGEYFSRPSYQDDVVPAYVKSLNGTHAGLFNPDGRAYPDISAQGLYYKYFWDSSMHILSGSSASTPLVASIIALVNDALLSEGKPPLGFLNLWLYSKGYQGFTDIISGKNGGCGTTGFPTQPGWDAVTGFGTPIFPELLKLSGVENWEF